MMIPRALMRDHHSRELPDYFTAADLAGHLDPATLDRLSALAEHVGLDGRPCWVADRLYDLLALEEVQL